VTPRDRAVVAVVGVFAVLGAFWFLALAPKRKAAQDLVAQVATQTQRLETAKQSAAAAAVSRDRYDRDYATVARLGKAVPVDDEVPSLVYQLETAAAKTNVDFRSMKLEASQTAPPPAPAAAAVASTKEQTPGSGAAAGSSSTTSSTTSTTTAAPATSAVAATLPPGASIGPAGFPTMPFSFAFDGSYFGMEHFLRELNRFTRAQPDRIDVRGRLLTVDSVSLVAGRTGYPRVKAAISATAYLLPAEQGLAAGASPAAPGAPAAAAAPAGTATPASTPGSAPTPAATATGAKP
jgi:hypothetical protein